MNDKRFYITHEDDVDFLESGQIVSPVNGSNVSSDIFEGDEPKYFGDGWDWMIFDVDTGEYVDAATTYDIAERSVLERGTLVKDLKHMSHEANFDRAMSIL
jgi:hypothetical protein